MTNVYVSISHLCIVVVAGFEEPEYNISESGGSQEVCVIVSNPPQDTPLVTDIILIASTSTDGTTAGMTICNN